MRIISNLWQILWAAGLGSLVSFGSCLTEAGEVGTSRQVLTNVAQFYRAVGAGHQANYAARLEGVICWADPSNKSFVLEDDSGAVFVKANFEGAPIRLGSRVRLEGDCAAQRTGLAVGMREALVVDNDGLHVPSWDTGVAFLKAGFNPIRLAWFNSKGDGVLNAWYRGPGVLWQSIPAGALFRAEETAAEGATNRVPGMHYQCFEGEWDFVPNFSQLTAVTNGVAAGFDISVRTRPESVGLEFTGYLKVPQEGLYTFGTESDDGSLLFAGALRVTELGTAVVPRPRPLAIGKILPDAEEFHRCEVEGQVRFVDERQRALRLELSAGEDRVLVEIADARGARPEWLAGSRLRATGICHGTMTVDGRKVAGYVWVPGWRGEVEMLAEPGAPPVTENLDGNLPLLTTIAQVRQLSREAASQAYPVRVRGVVTARFDTTPSLVVQDAGPGIYVRITRGNTRRHLEIGDACEIIGTTRGGSWAPAIDAQRVVRLGLGRLPEPLHPSWDQILNGSLDSQYVELQGIVAEVHETGVELVTRVGRIEMDFGGRTREEWQHLEDALVRVRGCVFAAYSPATRLAVSGKIRFVQPSITVDEYPPADLFTVRPKRVAELRSFDPQVTAFQRVKVSGQIVHAHNGLYCLTEGTNGLRFFPKKETPLPVGAQVEVVGLADLSGPSPALREAVVRVGNRFELPEATVLAGTNLLSGARVATLVRVESLLLNASQEAGDQVLEVRTGSHVHRARLHTSLGLMKPIPIGSRLALTGVYLGKGGNWAAGQDIEGFDLVLNSPADITMLERPSWWTPRRLLGLAGSLAVILILALGWIRVLHRQVEERTRQLAQQIQARERLERQRALEEERTRLARDLHDDLGGGLTEISLLGSLATDSALPLDRRTGYLTRMTGKARELVGALDEIVWAVNPRYNSLSSLTAYYSLYAQRFLSLASLRCRLEVAPNLPDASLDSTVRHNLFLAFKEALNNVVRHAEASEVRLRILAEDEELIVSVADNGRGLPPGATTASGMDGLANMRARLSAMGGRCEIQSVPAHGTTVIFGVRLPQ